MIVDALLAAEPHMKIADQIEDPQRYVYLTDDIKLRIQDTTDPVSLHSAEDIHATDNARRRT